MEYRPLGRSGITVSRLKVGAMMFGAVTNSHGTINSVSTSVTA